MQQAKTESNETNQRPLSEIVVEYVNQLRTRPVEYSNTFDNIEADLKKNRVTEGKIKSFVNFIHEFKAKASRSLVRSGILNELAGQVAEKFQEVSNDSHLKSLIEENYSGVSHIAFYAVWSEETDAHKIVNDILLDDKNRKDFFLNNNFKIIGIHQKKADDETNKHLFVVLIADEINEGSEHTYGQRIVNEINNFRSSPMSFVSHLEAFKNKTKNEFPNTKKDFIKELETFTDSLKKRNTLRNSAQVKLNEGLTAAAREHLDQLEQKNSRKFFAQDEDYLAILLSHFVEGFTDCKEIISTDIYQPKKVILDLLVSEKDNEKQSRKTLLNSSYSQVGIANRIIKGTRVTAIIFTDKAENLKPVSFEEGLTTEINRIRAYPKSYVKYFQSILDNNEVPKGYSKKQQETFLKNVAATIEFLQNVRSLAPFLTNSDLNKAAAAKVQQFTSQKKVTQSSEEQLREFLGEFGTGFFNVSQLDDVGSTSPLEYLKDILIPRNTLKNCRDIIFSRSLNYIGVAVNVENVEKAVNEEGEEVEEDEKIRVILLADNFEADLEKFDTSVISRQIVLKRPNLNSDEILQIRSDFKLFDVTNSGNVKPGPLLYFLEKSPSFTRLNFIYYEAFKLLNTEENNANGVDVEEFINAVKKVFFFVYEEERWKDLYNLYYGDSKRKVIDFDVLKRVATDLKYKITDEDLLQVIDRLENNGMLDLNKFTEIMKIVENLGRAK